MGAKCSFCQNDEQQILSSSIPKSSHNSKKCATNQEGQILQKNSHFEWAHLGSNNEALFKPHKQQFISKPITIRNFSEQSSFSFDEFSIIPMCNFQLTSTPQQRSTPIFADNKELTPRIHASQCTRKKSRKNNQRDLIDKKRQFDCRILNKELKAQKQGLTRQLNELRQSKNKIFQKQQSNKSDNISKSSLPFYDLPLRRSRSMITTKKKVHFRDDCISLPSIFCKKKQSN